MIVLEEVESNFNTADDLTIELRGINLSIDYGEAIAIIGKSNSEKTAILRCVSCLDKPKNGSIQLDNFNFSEFDQEQISQIKQNISFIDSNKTLLETKSAFENIALPLILKKIPLDEISRRINIVSKELKLIDKLPLKPQQLSKTSRTLVCIARAIITSPKLIVCDDITQGLDLKNSLLIAKTLQNVKINAKIAIILATNDLELIKVTCDKVFVIDKSNIVEKSNTEQFILNPTSYLGKEFIKAKSRLELPTSIRKQLEPEASDGYSENTLVIRCCFYQKANAEIVISKLIDKLDLKINILSAHQELINSCKLNIMLLELTGTKNRIIEATIQLNQNELFTEALGYVE